MKKQITAAVLAGALFAGVALAPTAMAVNDFSATCASDGTASFQAISSSKGAWYAYTWRTNYTVNGYGYVWVPAYSTPSFTSLTPQYGGVASGTTKFGVVRGLLSTKYSYVLCS